MGMMYMSGAVERSPLTGAEAARFYRSLPRLTREQIAWRAAQELADWSYVNVGIGIPTLVPNYLGHRPVIIHAECGMLKVGPMPRPGKGDWDLCNAAGEMVTELPGSAYFDIVESFAMMRGGHIDVAIMGAFQVSERGDLANWNNPARGLNGGMGSIGGCMDLAAGARQIIITMEHVTRDGDIKILRECTFPLTAPGCVDLIITDLALIRVTPAGLLLAEVAPGVSADDVQRLTEPALLIAGRLGSMDLPAL